MLPDICRDEKEEQIKEELINGIWRNSIPPFYPTSFFAMPKTKQEIEKIVMFFI